MRKNVALVFFAIAFCLTTANLLSQTKTVSAQSASQEPLYISGVAVEGYAR